MTIPTEREVIDQLERAAGAEIDRAATVAKRHDYEAAVLGPRVAACGHMLAINTPDSLIRGMSEEALGGPLEPPAPPPRFGSEAAALAWAWGDET
jgi:hypothetical protein